MDKVTFHFIYLYGPDTIEFNMHHYISVMSNICENGADAIIWTNNVDRMNNNYWIKMIQSEYNLTIKDVKPIYTAIYLLTDQVLEDLPYMAHVADMCRLYIMANNKGVYSDVDSIAVRPLPKEWFYSDKDIFCLETDSNDCLCNGFFIANNHAFLMDWLMCWKDYNPKECRPGTPDWTKYSVQLGWNVSLMHEDEIQVLPPFTFQPKYLTYKDTCDLFFLDRYHEIKDNLDVYEVHLWETRNQHILKLLDDRYFKESKATYAQLGSPYV